MLTSVDPLTGSIDLRVRLNSGDNGRCRHVYLSGAFDDLLECRANISLSLGEEANSVRMSVHRGSIPKSVLLGDRHRAAPVHEITVNLLTLWMRANFAFRRVTTLI